MDAHANIIYGFPFEGDDFDFDNEVYSNDPEIWVATHQGLLQPEGDWNDNEDAHRAYCDDVEALPIDTVCEGDLSSGQTTTYLIVKEAQIDGDWCGGTKIPVGHIQEPPAEWDELLKAFCKKAGIPFGQPEWLLIASCG